jgi:tripartite-type tricarboxylate transporter receptor subunit TctC
MPSHSSPQPTGLRRRDFHALLAAAALPGLARAADEGLMTIMVNAGVIMDAAARLVAEHLRTPLHREVIVQQKFGAGGRLALTALKNMHPDGRNVLLTANSALTIAPNIYKNLDYDPVADFTPITGVCVFDNAIAVGPASPAKTLPELMKWAAGRPEGLAYGAAPGTGSASHFVGIAIGLKGNFKATVVPYKEAQPAFADLISGRLEALISSTGGMAPLHKSGSLRILASSGSRRSPLLPDVPTLREAGIDVAIDNGTMLLGPAKMAPQLAGRIHAAVKALTSDPEVVKQLTVLGMTPWPLGPAELTQWLATDRQRFAALTKASGFVPE